MQTFRDLKVYQLSYQLTLEVYRLTEKFPGREQFELGRQMRRAASSIPLNLAEGYGRKSSQDDFAHFVRIGIGSTNEMTVLLDLCRDLRFVSKVEHIRLSGRYLDLLRQLKNLMKALKRSKI